MNTKDKLQVSFLNERRKTKPSNQEAGIISNVIAKKKVTLTHDEIHAFAKSVGEHGASFCPATFKNGKRSKDDFEQLQLLALDFDNKDPKQQISFCEVKNRAETYDMPILFAYETLTSNNCNKFRVIFLNDISINNKKLAEAVIFALYNIFPESDSSCSRDISRMYYGGKKLIYFDTSIPTIDVELIFRNLNTYYKLKSGKNYKRNLKQFSQITGIELDHHGLLDVKVAENQAEVTGVNECENFSPNPYILIEGFGEFYSKKYIIKMNQDNTKPLSTNNQNNNKKNKIIHNTYRSNTINSLYDKCKLYHEFHNGRILHHDELFGLATNLIHIESGISTFNNILKHNHYFDDRITKYTIWENHLTYIKKQNYHPYSCNNFCSYADICTHGTNILSSINIKHHEIEKIKNINEDLVTIEEAEKDFKSQLLSSIHSANKGRHIIKAQVALGKTETYLQLLQLLKETVLKILIAVPTNRLRSEVAERALNMGIQLIESPSLHDIKDELPDEVWEKIEFLYKSGMSVFPYIRKKIEEDDPKCKKVFERYLQQLDNFHQCKGHAITTHRRLLTMDVSKFDLVIIDEDIIFSSIIPNKTDISIKDLKRVQKKLPESSPIRQKMQKAIEKSKENEFFTLPKIEYDSGEDDRPTGIDLPSFCSATHFCFRSDRDSENKNDLSDNCISFLNPVKFSSNVKYIMVSATVDENICNYYFGSDNVTFYECKTARFMGTLNQYYDRSLSRKDMQNTPEIINKIKQWSGFEHTITFKNQHRGELYFGNAAGCDHLKGQNIDVIGTPHQPEWIYKLFAYSMNLDCDIDEKIQPGITVDHNGYRFRFTTYRDEILKNIQFYMIESELEQAVGRARLLRKDCTVNLFSNFPLMQANMKQAEYLKE